MYDEWIVLFPIEDLKIESGSFAAADIKLYRLTDTQMNQWIDWLKEKGLTDIYDKFKNSICAEIEIDAPDKKAANEQARSKIRSLLDVFRIFTGKYELHDPLIGLFKNKRTGKVEWMHWQAEWTQKSAWPLKCEIKHVDESQLSKSVGVLEPFLRSPNSCELNRKIIRALRWSADATQEINEADKVLKCITALECLFLKETRGKAKILAERIAIIWTNSNIDRDKIFKDIKGLYELRNCIVHGDSYQITERDKSILDRCSRQLVFTVADVATKNSFTKVEEIINFIKQQKGGWNAPSVPRRPC